MEVIAIFGDETLTRHYRFILDEHDEFKRNSGRYDLCSYQYAYFIMAAIIFEAVGISDIAENYFDLEILEIYRDIPAYVPLIKTINGKVSNKLAEYMRCTLSEEFTELSNGPLVRSNIELFDITGTYDKPVFEFCSSPYSHEGDILDD